MVYLIIVAMIAVRLWTRYGPRNAQPVTNPIAAALLLWLTGVSLPWGDYRYALVGVVVIAGGYLAAIRWGRRFFTKRYPRPLYTTFVAIPLSTVAFEEAAFRGVLWPLIAADHGPLWATAITAVLFGLWHLSPDRAWTDALAMTVAGAVLGGLRDVSGGLLAPVAVHWAADGLGVLASTYVLNQWGGTQSRVR
ncbi:CPBP family intramembrane glutamic endopeptidase [Actinoplanes sp. NPDC051851]|uniref:CPBP family intramembrane glutamic endopeptidase n=1 Tax=Actinoplanes sp. NPDC051851 TaxID=3154753 RepID=UPI0034385DE9